MSLDSLLSIFELACDPRSIRDLRGSWPLSKDDKPGDASALYDKLVRSFGFQGISDHAARTFAEQHGSADWNEVRDQLATAGCGKLRSHWHFAECGFKRSAGSCNNPALYPVCSLPGLPQRRGSLNQTAFSLALFIRDVCDDDIEAWIDSRLESVLPRSGADLGRALANAVTGPMTHVYGVSRKVVTMTLADLLLSAGPERPLWWLAGSNMVAIDTLVHNLMHRTGTLQAFDASHAYGPSCYKHGHCADLVRQVADLIDASRFDPSFPAVFPRLVQHGLWRFCAREELDICNAVNVPDLPSCSRPCSVRTCIRASGLQRF